MPPRTRRTYDHRLIRLVHDTGDASIATRLGVPRSTVAGWLRRPHVDVITAARVNESAPELRARVQRLERRGLRLAAALRVAIAVIRVAEVDLAHLRIPDGKRKLRLLRAIDRSRGVLGLGRILALMGLSPARLSAWRRSAVACELDDQPACPGSSPHGLTPREIDTIRHMVTDPGNRHVPTGRLAIFAQRPGCVFAFPTTWYRLVSKFGWRRPRLRIHPTKPTKGIRASEPDEIWHIDTTVIRMLDGTRAYLHAVIDNFSRRILSWRLSASFDAGCSADLLVEAGQRRVDLGVTPTLLADGGVENDNRAVDAVVASGMLKRVLAQTKISFSNSLIEAWWRSLKHNWPFLHPLDTAATVRRHVAFYVGEHNNVIPHSAFKGQTPHEMYFGRGDGVPDRLEEARAEARARRMEENRARRRAVCA
jgi:putative transposase